MYYMCSVDLIVGGKNKTILFYSILFYSIPSLLKRLQIRALASTFHTES